MNRTASSLIAIIVGFIAGMITSIGTSWLLKTYIFPPDKIYVRGMLKYQSHFDPSASAAPPNGYFVESSATERFYVEGELVKPFTNTLVQISGTLSTICGPDGYPCFPKLIVKDVVPAPK